MNRSSLKSGIFLITYGIVLYLVLSHIGLVAGAGSYIMTVLRPVIIGVVMAYVINLLMRPMETKWLAGLWRRCPRLARGKRGLCIVLSILGVLAIITALCLFILPQVGESLLSLANSIPGYLADAGDFFNGLESRLDMENEVISYLWKQGGRADQSVRYPHQELCWKRGDLAAHLRHRPGQRHHQWLFGNHFRHLHSGG